MYVPFFSNVFPIFSKGVLLWESQASGGTTPLVEQRCRARYVGSHLTGVQGDSHSGTSSPGRCALCHQGSCLLCSVECGRRYGDDVWIREEGVIESNHWISNKLNHPEVCRWKVYLTRLHEETEANISILSLILTYSRNSKHHHSKILRMRYTKQTLVKYLP